MGGACVKCTLKQRSSRESSSSSSSKISAGGSTSPSFRSISLASSGERHNDSSPKSTAASGGWSPVEARKSSSSGSRLITVQPGKKPSCPDYARILQYENDVFGLADHRVQGEQALVIIYGGPGSKKGTITENLKTTFGFNLLSCEELILRRLPPIIERRARKDGLVYTPQHVIGGGACLDGECVKEDDKITQNLLGDMKEDTPTWYTKGSKSEDPIRQLKMMMKDYPEELSLHWVLEQVVDEIEDKFSNKNSYMLVDLIPNFQFLLEIPTFSLQNCAQELLWLERKFPCMFALHLEVTDDNKLSIAPRLPVPKGNEASGIKSEIDEAKRKLRRTTYREVLAPHLQHFRREHRLITVDVSHASQEHTWWHVKELFCSLFFTPRAAHNTIVIFASGDHDIRVDCSKNQNVLMLQLDKNSYESEEVFLKDFEDKLSTSSIKDQAVVVVCHMNLRANLEFQQKKRIKFVENGDPFTRFVVREGNHCVVNYKGDTFKAITAPGNLVCCFPTIMDDKFCRQMAANATNIFQQRLVL